MSIIEFKNVSYYYEKGNTKILDKVNYKFEQGRVYAIVGESGCGKTTTLSLMGALDRPKEGNILFKGKDIKKIGDNNYRRNDISIIFQSYNLIPYMTALQNVITGMEISNAKLENKKNKALDILKEVNINEEQAKRNILKLSGGQQQRVAISRALACNVDLILADEPTGNLDETTTTEILSIFRKLADEGKCVIIVTHSKYVAQQADTVLTIQSGQIVEVDAIKS